MLYGNIFDIQRNSFVDGPGIRTTVFFKGCNLNCAWCHNPESQKPSTEMMIYKNKCIGCGKCQSVCTSKNACVLCGKCELFCPQDARKVCGKKYTVEEVLNKVTKDKAYYENSGGGVTLSGGECMLQAEFVLELLKKLKEECIHTAIDTAGSVPFECFEKILPYTDLFLYDVKIWDSQLHKRYVGADNRLILDNLERLFEKNARVWVRIPVIKGVNDNIDDFKKIRNFIGGRAEKVELLPYHPMGENKYTAIGKAPQVFDKPDEEALNAFKEIFS